MNFPERYDEMILPTIIFFVIYALQVFLFGLKSVNDCVHFFIMAFVIAYAGYYLKTKPKANNYYLDKNGNKIMEGETKP